jgi:hypothetical protein
MQLFGGIRSFSVLSLLVFLFGLPLSAQQFVADFASRTSPSAKVIPPGIIAAQLGFLTGSASLNQLKQDGYAELRTNAQLPNIFLTSSTPDWTHRPHDKPAEVCWSENSDCHDIYPRVVTSPP